MLRQKKFQKFEEAVAIKVRSIFHSFWGGTSPRGRKRARRRRKQGGNRAGLFRYGHFGKAQSWENPFLKRSIMVDERDSAEDRER